MAEKNHLAGLPDEKGPVSESAAPPEVPAAMTQPKIPKGTLEDFKIPREEIDGSARERLEISHMSDRIRAEIEFE